MSYRVQDALIVEPVDAVRPPSDPARVAVTSGRSTPSVPGSPMVQAARDESLTPGSTAR